MQLILLSGGSGTRLWPLSNDARSKQFLKLLPKGDTERESMIQRIIRQIKESKLDASITIATSYNQKDSVISQLANAVDVVVEPSRRNTFPAICLACVYLNKVKQCDKDEVILVMPCDPFTDLGYFDTIKSMAKGIEAGKAELVVMGIEPTYPSAKYGYIVPESDQKGKDLIKVSQFIEKPSVKEAERLITKGALWNGGVFAFRLGYILDIAEKYYEGKIFEDYLNNYDKFPKISFDYEVAEKAKSVAVVPFNGIWKDLGTWNTLTDELPFNKYGNVITDDTVKNTHIINELGLPLLCMGTEDLVIAASPDGIIVTEKKKSENIKQYAEQLKHRPMYEERRWGTYRVLHSEEFADGYCVLTKELTLRPGCAISYQRHNYRDEVWTFVDGEGILVIDDVVTKVSRGATVTILRGQKHALKAETPLTFIEIQRGQNLIEEDIERFEYEWY